MCIKQTEEQKEETRRWFIEAIGELKAKFNPDSPADNRALRDKLEEMKDNLEYLQMR
jgi:hypothetical protein